MVQLAEELLEAIFCEVFRITDEELMKVVSAPRRGSAVALANKAFNRICTPHLYHTVVLPSSSHADKFLRTLDSNPGYASLVKAVGVDGAFEAFLEIAKYLAKSAEIQTVSMNIRAFSGTYPGDALGMAMPHAAPYLGSTVAMLKPRTVIVADTQSYLATESCIWSGPRLNFRQPEYEVRRARGKLASEMQEWTQTKHVHLNLLMRLQFFKLRLTPPVNFDSISLRLDLGQDEREHLRVFAAKWRVEHINITPHGHSTTFLPEYLHELSKDPDLRKRVHFERHMMPSRKQVLLGEGRKPSRTPFADAAATGRRWEL